LLLFNSKKRNKKKSLFAIKRSFFNIISLLFFVTFLWMFIVFLVKKNTISSTIFVTRKLLRTFFSFSFVLFAEKRRKKKKIVHKVCYMYFCVYIPTAINMFFNTTPVKEKHNLFALRNLLLLIYIITIYKKEKIQLERFIFHYYYTITTTRHKKIINKNAERCQTRSTRQGEPSPSVPRAYVKPPVPFFVFFSKKQVKGLFDWAPHKRYETFRWFI